MRYAIRPLSVGEILDSGFRLLRNHFALLVGITAFAIVPLTVLQVALARISLLDKQTAAALAVPVLCVLALTAVVYLVAMPLIATAVPMAICDIYVGRPTSVRQALRQAWSILLPVFGTQMLVFLFVMLGFVLLIIPGIWLAFAYWVVVPVMVGERVFGRAALRRSAELMRGQKLRAAATGLPLLAPLWILAFGIGFGLQAWPTVRAVLPSAVGIVTTPLLNAVIVVFYFDVRCRHEAFDLEHLAQLVEQRGAAPVAAVPAL